jgi:hypothetical protein
MPGERTLEENVLDVVTEKSVVYVSRNGMFVDGESSQSRLHSEMKIGKFKIINLSTDKTKMNRTHKTGKKIENVMASQVQKIFASL